MLRAREVIRRRGQTPTHKLYRDNKFYAELIFDSAGFMSSLPHSIEAVFYIKPSPTQRVGCGVGVALSGNKCTRYAKQAHANMRAHFGLNAQELPFVMFDPWDWARRPPVIHPGPSARCVHSSRLPRRRARGSPAGD